MTIKKTTPQAQLWALLKTDDQKMFLANQLRPLKKKIQNDICIGIIAFLKWGIIRPFEANWLITYFKGLILYFQVERELGKI